MSFLDRGVRLFRVSRVTVYLDYSWFILFFLVVWTFARFYFPAVRITNGLAPWIFGTSAAILLLASVVLHELSHALVSNALGFPIRRIRLFIFGGVAEMQSEPKDPKTEFLVAGAGPLSSLLLWGIFSAAAMASRLSGSNPAYVLLTILAHLNLALALFNLVPGFPLDGGRLFRAIVWSATGSYKRATNFAAKGGAAFAYLLMILGVLTIYREQSPGGWVSGIWYVLIGMFLRNAAEQSYARVLIEDVLAGIAVSEVMGQNVMSVAAGESIQEAVEKRFLHNKFTLYPVTDSEGHVVGIVDLEDVRKLSREECRRAVAEVMRPIPAWRLPKADSQANDALGTMLALGAALLPVVDEGGRLAGIVSRTDIMRMFQIRADLGDRLVA
jgi:Zn-dependent protease/CBS domain-containing protein